MYRKILVAVDLQDQAGTVKTLEALNDYVSEGMEVELLSVLPGISMPLVASYFPEDMIKQALDTMRVELTRLADAHLVKEMNVSVWVTTGKVPKRIVARAAEIDADLILIRALKHGRVEKMVMGSVTAKVAQTAERSVLVIR